MPEPTKEQMVQGVLEKVCGWTNIEKCALAFLLLYGRIWIVIHIEVK